MRVIGPAIDRIVRLPVGQFGRDIGLADNHRARPLEALHNQGISIRQVVAGMLQTPCRWRACQMKAFLHRHWDAKKRLIFAGTSLI